MNLLDLTITINGRSPNLTYSIKHSQLMADRQIQIIFTRLTL